MKKYELIPHIDRKRNAKQFYLLLYSMTLTTAFIPEPYLSLVRTVDKQMHKYLNKQ